MYMLDSDVCINCMRGKDREVFNRIIELTPANFKISSIVLAELWYGVEHSNSREANASVLEIFLHDLQIAPFDETCARAYSKIREHLSTKGMLIGPNDMLIAASAIANDATLVSNNIREFSRVPCLKVESWSVERV